MNNGSGGGSGPSPSPTSPRNEGWKLLGSEPLFGLTDDDAINFGKDVALSNDGNRLVVGQPGVDLSLTELAVGRVNIYDWNQNESIWELDAFFDGTGRDSRAGSSVSINGNGTRIAIGEPTAFGERGQVSIYEQEFVTGEWFMVGDEPLSLEDDTMMGKFGFDVAMSDDGTTIACSAPFTDLSENYTSTGLVRVYQQERIRDDVSGTTIVRWSQRGQDILGRDINESLGWSLAMSADGNVLAIGAIGLNDNAGSVRVFIWNGQYWQLTGEQLGGINAEDRFGISLDLSADGTILAVGASQYPDGGQVTVWERFNDDRWTMLGQPIDGSTSPRGKLGSSLDLDVTGFIVAVGSPDHSSSSSGGGSDGDENDDGGLEANGMVQVYKYDRTLDDWVQQNGDVEGSLDRDGFGSAVALSADGSRVAGGAPRATFDGRFNEVGRVEVYDMIVVPDETE